MNRITNWHYVGIAAALGAALAVCVFFVTTAITTANIEGTKRITACVDSGGTWIDYYSMCIAADRQVQK